MPNGETDEERGGGGAAGTAATALKLAGRAKWFWGCCSGCGCFKGCLIVLFVVFIIALFLALCDVPGLKYLVKATGICQVFE